MRYELPATHRNLYTNFDLNASVTLTYISSLVRKENRIENKEHTWHSDCSFSHLVPFIHCWCVKGLLWFYKAKKISLSKLCKYTTVFPNFFNCRLLLLNSTGGTKSSPLLFVPATMWFQGKHESNGVRTPSFKSILASASKHLYTTMNSIMFVNIPVQRNLDFLL